MAGGSKSPPATFSHPSEVRRTYFVRLTPSVAAALLDESFGTSWLYLRPGVCQTQ